MTCECQSGRAKGQGRCEVWFKISAESKYIFPTKRKMVNEDDCPENFLCIAKNMCAHVFFPADLLSIHFSLCTQVLRQTNRYRWRNLPSSIFLGSGSLFYRRKAWFRKKTLFWSISSLVKLNSPLIAGLCCVWAFPSRWRSKIFA